MESAYGNGFSSATGIFTCNQPGLYYFSSSLVKTRSYSTRIDQIICYMYKNSNRVTYTRTDPTDDDTDFGSYETSMFHITHLSFGDQVYIKCTSGSLEVWSTFSGFLIVSD